MAHWDIGSFITGMVDGLIPVFFFWLGYWYRLEGLPMTTRRRRHTLAIAAAALKGFHTGLAGGSLSDNYFIATNQRTAWIFGFEDGVKQRALSDGWLISGTIFVGDKVTGPNGYEARIVGIGSPEQNEDQTRSPIDPHSAGNTGE